MAQALVDGDHIIIEAEHREREYVDAVGNARWRNERWRLPLGLPTMYRMHAAFPTGTLNVSDELSQLGQDLYLHQEKARRFLDADDDQIPTAYDSRLRPKQVAAVQFILMMGRALVTDEMGSGKTVMGCVALEASDKNTAIIVCPAAARRTWENHMRDWAPSFEVQTAGRTAGARRKAIKAWRESEAPRRALIISLPSIHAHVNLAAYGTIRLSEKDRDPKELGTDPIHDALIIDEAHRLADPKSNQTRAAVALAGHLADHSLRIGFTGTPIANKPDDLWSIMRVIDPYAFGSKTHFVERYCETVLNWHSGFNDVIGILPHMKTEFDTIMRGYQVRRTLDEVLGHVIEEIEQKRYVEMTPKQAKAYAGMRDDLVAWVGDDEDDALIAENVLVQTGRLRQLAAGECEIDEDGKLRIVKSWKPDDVWNLWNETGREPLVVFAEHRDLLELLATLLTKKGVSFGMMHGGIDAEACSDYEERFQGGDFDIVIGTFGTMSEVYTLDRARREVFMQRSWSMVKNKQADFRVKRITQKAESVVRIELLTEATIEAHVHDTYGTKLDILDQVTNDRARLKELF